MHKFSKCPDASVTNPQPGLASQTPAAFQSHHMKLISWNVNGIRAVLKKGFIDFIDVEKPDIICVQETKAHPDDVEHGWHGYEANWNWAEKKGYSGVLTLSKKAPLSVTRGIAIVDHDREGRVLTTEYPDFFLVNVYVPNSQRELGRLPYRQEWDRDFLAYLRNLESKKPVIFCGDLNVAHTEIDLARPKDNVKNHGFTPEERAGFDAIVKAGFVDTFREFEKGGGHYTWWSQMGTARSRNIGWRIDYFLCSAALRPQLKVARIYKDVIGSDHCPIGLELKQSKRAKPE
jgi:exodeoxyribonuclease III